MGKKAEWFEKEIEKIKKTPQYIALGIGMTIMEDAWKYKKDNNLTLEQISGKCGMTVGRFKIVSSEVEKLNLNEMAKIAELVGKRLEVKLVKKNKKV